MTDHKTQSVFCVEHLSGGDVTHISCLTARGKLMGMCVRIYAHVYF